ncbi:EAL domain-containing protein [uncultured Shewanella sp.]|uniref:EAL domain-containing protein n=1 Tax=Shewanella atlantica TaxID=271099 RepID=UPI00262D72A4|nr:EAL domain-containing protein [uncultured Shewanella sp.]
MSLTKIFQGFLFLLFAGLSFFVYLEQTSLLSEKAHSRLTLYQNGFTAERVLPPHGSELLAELGKQNKFQFFQYIHSTDSSYNLTEGELISSSAHPLAVLFPIELSDTRSFDEGRLQVKLYKADLQEKVIGNFQHALIALITTYLLLAISFSLLMFRFKRAIRYSANYINGLSNHSFTAFEPSKLSSEFKPISLALEASKVKLKANLDKAEEESDKLTKIAYQDPVTGLPTRAVFTQKLESFSALSKEQIGLMAIIKATELAQINDNLGRTAGDDYLAEIANCIRKSISEFPDSECFRISTADFAVFIPGLILKDGIPFLESLKSLFDEYQQSLSTESVAHVGLVPYQHDSEPVKLLTLADTAVSIAQTLGPNCFHMQDKFNGDEIYGDTRWKDAIDDLIKRQALKFYQQPIHPCRTEVLVYKELLTRFYNSEGKFLPTTTVIAMAERHGMILELDKLIIIKTMMMLINNPNMDGAYGINISASSIMQDSFVAWIKDQLGKKRHIAARLVFELNESGMQTNLSASHKFVRVLHSVGARVSVEHFGMGFTSFKFFKEVRPDYIKLDGSYTDGIAQDTNNKFFIKMIVDIARRLGIRVIATSVERQEEKLILERMHIDGLQGYYISQPQAALTSD